MECFAHPDSGAVGVCKSCGKGACRLCAIPVTRGLDCSAKITASGRPIGFSGGRLLPIAGLNLPALFTALAIILAVLNGLSRAFAD